MLAFKLMLSAERLLSESPGKERFESVFGALYKAIPAWLKYFVPEVTLREKLQEWYNRAKDSLDDEIINNSI